MRIIRSVLTESCTSSGVWWIPIPICLTRDVQGCLTRLSTVTLLNVTAGGGSTVPTFLIEHGRARHSPHHSGQFNR